MKKNVHMLRAFFLASLFTLFVSTLCFATTRTWLPTAGGSWATAGNWSGGVAPVANDDIIINSDQSANITAVPNITLNSLTVSGNCTLVGSNILIQINNNFSVSLGKTLSLGPVSGSRVDITLLSTATGTINGTVSMDLGSGASHPFINNGILILGASGIINGPGGFTLGTTATIQVGSAAGISSTGASGNIQSTGTITFPVGATYIYNGAAAQNTGTGLPTNLTGTFRINNPGNTVTLDNARTIANGGTVDIISGTFAAGTNLTMASTSSITRSGGTMSGTPQGAGTYNVTYTGSSMNTSTELAGSGINNVTLNMTAGQNVTLDVNRTIANVLTLTSGNLVIPAGLKFTITSTNAIGGSGFSSTKNIITQINTGTGAKGFLRVNIGAGATRNIPVGDGSNYLPLTLTPANANGFDICVFNGITGNGEPNGTPFTPAQKNTAVDAVWYANLVSGTAGAGVTMVTAWPSGLEGTAFSGYSNTSIGIGHYNSGTSAWEPNTGTGDNSANTATRSGITVFSPFGVGRVTMILPVSFNWFNAGRSTNSNILNWQASCSSNQVVFDVERSSDGRNFISIYNITASQARCAQPFSYTDNTAPAGLLFYRIRSTDIDGAIRYSAVIKLGSQVKNARLEALVPNPVINEARLSIQAAKKDHVELQIISSTGKPVQNVKLDIEAGTSIINLDLSRLQSGLYIIKGIFSDGSANSVKFIKQ